jgi:hypothetical protein
MNTNLDSTEHKGLSWKLRTMSTMLIINLIAILMVVSFAILFLIQKFFFHGSIPNIIVSIFVIWLALLWNSMGLITIIRKEIPRFPPARAITGKLAVVIGIITIALGLLVQIGVIINLI